MQGGVQSLVEGGVRRFGRWGGRPEAVNPLDEFTGLARRLRSLRLKEWVGFTLLHPDWYCSFIIQDAHYLSSSEIYAYDRSRGALRQQTSARPGSLGLPAGLFGERFEYRRPGYVLSCDFAPAGGRRHRLRFDIAATGRAPSFQGELELDARRASPPLSVSSRLPDGKLYTHKALFPAGGSLSVGGRTMTFDPDRDLAILDEHRSLFPYRTHWVWGTLGTRDAGGAPVGANFCARPLEPGEEEESCIWTPEACEPLADISFTRGTDLLGPWHIASRDGRLEVTFEPEGSKGVKHQLGVVEIDYFQLFGRYRGVLRGAGAHWDLDGVHGVCESFRARL